MEPRGVRYTPAQREALAATYDPRCVTAGEVVARAAAGELEHPSGAKLEPFHTTPSTVRSFASRARERQAREVAKGRLAELSSRDAVDRLYLEAASLIEHELDRIELEQAAGRAVRGEEIRQLIRATRELACLPGPNDPRPRPPGAKLNGHREGSETRGGLAGKLLRAAESNGRAPLATGSNGNGEA